MPVSTKGGLSAEKTRSTGLKGGNIMITALCLTVDETVSIIEAATGLVTAVGTAITGIIIAARHKKGGDK